MRTIAERIYLDSDFGTLSELPSSDGSALENPYVYDSSAQELKAMADVGLVRIVDESSSGEGTAKLIRRLVFERLR